MKSLLKLSSVLAITLILTACGGEETVSSNTAGSLPDTTVDHNSTPVISGTPTTSVEAGSGYMFTPVASDADGDTLSFSVVNLPSWANFDSNTGAVSGTPASGDAGFYNDIVISVSDGSASASLNAFNISVANVSAVQPGGQVGFSTTTQSVTEGSIVSVTIMRTNGVGVSSVMYGTQGVTAISATTNGDDYMGFDPQLLTFADGETSKIITVQTLDNDLQENAETFEIYLTSPSAGYTLGSNAVVTIIDDDVAQNQPPTIGGNPATSVTVGATYQFTPTASDPNGDNLTFSVSNLPSWISINNGTGALSGTPSDNDVGVYNNILLIVSDGEDSTSLAAFSISVNPADANNAAPTISGTPATSVTEGELYRFTPSAADADDDQLTFSVSNLPGWASFDSTTGILQGTPGTGDSRVYSNISISVSDGTEQVSLDSFSITVNAAEVLTGSMALRWSAPTTRADGSPLDPSEIDGYCIYLGDSSSNMELIVDVNDGTVTDYSIADLAVGTYFVAVTTYDKEGYASSYSNVVEKSVTN